MRMQACSEGDELERGEEQFISNGKLISTIRAFLSTQRPSFRRAFPVSFRILIITHQRPAAPTLTVFPRSALHIKGALKVC